MNCGLNCACAQALLPDTGAVVEVVAAGWVVHHDNAVVACGELTADGEWLPELHPMPPAVTTQTAHHEADLAIHRFFIGLAPANHGCSTRFVSLS